MRTLEVNKFNKKEVTVNYGDSYAICKDEETAQRIVECVNGWDKQQEIKKLITETSIENSNYILRLESENAKLKQDNTSHVEYIERLVTENGLLKDNVNKYKSDSEMFINDISFAKDQWIIEQKKNKALTESLQICSGHNKQLTIELKESNELLKHAEFTIKKMMELSLKQLK